MSRFSSSLVFSAFLLASEAAAFSADTAVKSGRRADSSVEDAPGLPRVLIIGDSISMGYTAPVRELLKGKANVHRPAENCSGTRNGLKKLDAWLGKGKWDVIHFNFGLHDAKLLPEGTWHSDLPEYEKNLAELVNRMKATGARIIVTTTTPVPNGGVLAPNRRFGSIDEYNASAAKVMKQAGVVVDDLGSVITPQVDGLRLPNDVHYKPDGYALLARSVASSIEHELAAAQKTSGK